jgi:hypothetical protein
MRCRLTTRSRTRDQPPTLSTDNPTSPSPHHSDRTSLTSNSRAYDIGVAPHCPLGTSCIPPWCSSSSALPPQVTNLCLAGPLAFAASLQVGFSTPNFVICEMSWKVRTFSLSFCVLAAGVVCLAVSRSRRILTPAHTTHTTLPHGLPAHDPTNLHRCTTTQMATTSSHT